jgi:transcriptional regulator with GAF, ATPase, and Fis domain
MSIAIPRAGAVQESLRVKDPRSVPKARLTSDRAAAHPILGESAVMRRVLDVKRVAATDSTVLLLGVIRFDR